MRFFGARLVSFQRWFHLCFTIASLFSFAGVALAFPTWMGVYGNVDGNCMWQYTPDSPFAPGSMTIAVPLDATELNMVFLDAGEKWDNNRARDWLIPLVANSNEGDIDNDGLLDAWEQQIVDVAFDDAVTSIHDVDPNEDFDGDGISNWEEHELDCLDPTLVDSDGDGFSDGDEINGMLSDPCDPEDGAPHREALRSKLAQYWSVLHPAAFDFDNTPGSPDDLADLQRVAAELSGKFFHPAAATVTSSETEPCHFSGEFEAVSFGDEGSLFQILLSAEELEPIVGEFNVHTNDYYATEHEGVSQKSSWEPLVTFSH